MKHTDRNRVEALDSALSSAGLSRGELKYLGVDIHWQLWKKENSATVEEKMHCA